MIYTGTAAWSIPKIAAEHFPIEGSQLERYSLRLNAVEINSSFYKDHKAKSYKRWADSTPDNFRFSVKLHKRFTHECNLEIEEVDLMENLKDISALGEKWGVLLLQFPKSQDFDLDHMKIFYRTIRKVFKGPVALEARNLSWMSAESVSLMKQYHISKVIADPEQCPGEVEGEIKYYRLHGSPEIYKSNYEDDNLNNLYEEMNHATTDVWCIFDNTTFGYATNNAVTIRDMGGNYERYQRNHDGRSEYLHTIN
ncbi:DUF72 domain-containing protein [Bacteriovorax sp. PP10]|uniref:DUF72 domain-containing protein n=1 Tax=Bacteriovorax antarcticus TaxID=3088717 RepID=A0ABU5VZF1_9BACT|nr:DUF72 domain-containing protein [Bacteriovorax sp. PP10]MEA9357395.1 DUF72 domain-containing protein [Bacteriovorax sp. PP10]